MISAGKLFSSLRIIEKLQFVRMISAGKFFPSLRIIEKLQFVRKKSARKLISTFRHLQRERRMIYPVSNDFSRTGKYRGNKKKMAQFAISYSNSYLSRP